MSIFQDLQKPEPHLLESMIHKIIAPIFSKKLIIKNNITAFFAILFLLSCTTNKVAQEPIWYLTPKQNNEEFIYGTAQGYSMSQATKLALSDAAAKLMTTISAQTSTLIQENNFDNFEEIKQKVSENIEKINFNNYRISNSEKINQHYFIEVTIEKKPFLNEQQERLKLIQRKIAILDKSSQNTNHINRRNHLLEINELSKEASLKLRILSSNNQISNPASQLEDLLKYQIELEKFTNKIEFFIPENTNKLLKNTITKYLNKENIKIAQRRNKNNKNQILLKISLETQSYEIMENYITKTNITFKNILNNQIIASNKITLNGSSTLTKEKSFSSSIQDLENRLQDEDILQIIGILK